jgi:hypothetical protein
MGPGLTSDERRLLREVLAGADLDEIAEGLGASRADIRERVTTALRKVVGEAADGGMEAFGATASPRAAARDGTDRDRRRESRCRVFAPCRVVSLDGTIITKAALLDQSENGVRLRLSRTPLPGQTILIQLGHETIRTSEVVWVAGDDVGVRFTDNGRH